MGDAWPDWQIDSPRLTDAPDDRIVLVYRFVGTGRTSGVQVEHRVGVVAEFREGRAWRVQGYFEVAEALEAVGLSE